jgi:hypothetical protein
LDYSGTVTPVEVKAGINTKAKSLRVFLERYEDKEALLLTGRAMLPNRNNTVQLPLYMASKYPFL